MASAMICRANGNSSRGASISRNGGERLLGYVADCEQPRVGEVDDEMDAVVGPRGNVELQADFVRAVAGAIDAEVELNVELRLDLPRIDLRSARIFDRKVLHILREDRNLGLAVVGAVAARIWVPGPPFNAVLAKCCGAPEPRGGCGVSGCERLAAAFMGRNGAVARWAVLEYLR